MSLIFIDCEAPYGAGSPSVADMTHFGAVEYKSRATFHGRDCFRETFEDFREWLKKFPPPWVAVSDNPAYDWQWLNYYFWKYQGSNPMGHSARRIGDFYAGLCGDFWKSSRWKHLRITKHDHDPTHDALGNVEAFERIIRGER